VAYGGADGPDLEAAARATGLSPAEVVDLHAGTTYAVYMLGFLPGFAFLGDVAPALRLPRRAEPRTRVPRGAVAVAGQQTAVYPQESPGGWNLLGRCPVPLFDARRAPPALLAPGDRITFEPVSPEAFRAAEADLAAGRLLPDAFRVA
jgi:KipI family sensor histidine kinase inhibitor